MARVLVTGGSGFIGTNLVRHLRSRGHEVLNLDREPPMDRSALPCWRRTDILDRAGLREAFAEFEPTQLVHLAARTDLDGRTVADYAANTTGQAHVIDAAAATPTLQRALFASSRLVCRIGYQPKGPKDWLPTTPYGESKVEGERQLHADRSLRCPWTIVRPTSIWGPFFRVPYRNFFDSVRRGLYLHPRGLRVKKSFGYVGNSVVQIERLLEAPADAVHQQVFYLADSPPIELLQWATMIAAAMQVAPPRQVPMALLRAAAKAGDLLAAVGWRNVPLTSFRLANLVTPMEHDLAPLVALTGPPRWGLEQAVSQTVAWLHQGEPALEEAA